MYCIVPYKLSSPKIANDVFIAAGSSLIGEIELENKVGIWYNCVLRGDVAKILIGENSNVQDGTIIHGTRPNHLFNKTSESGGSINVGKNVTIGHACILHACNVADNCFVGMGSILMDLSTMEPNSMLAAGSLLTTGKTVRAGELWGGRPARFMRPLTAEEVAYIQTSADNYWLLALEHRLATSI